MPSKFNSKNDVKLEINLIGNCEEFSYMDSSVQCFNEYEDCEEVVVEQIAEKHWKTTEGQDTGDTTEHEGSRVQILFPVVTGLESNK
jgi:hypothetical protein